MVRRRRGKAGKVGMSRRPPEASPRAPSGTRPRTIDEVLAAGAAKLSLSRRSVVDTEAPKRTWYGAEKGEVSDWNSPPRAYLRDGDELDTPEEQMKRERTARNRALEERNRALLPVATTPPVAPLSPVNPTPPVNPPLSPAHPTPPASPMASVNPRPVVNWAERFSDLPGLLAQLLPEKQLEIANLLDRQQNAKAKLEWVEFKEPYKGVDKDWLGFKPNSTTGRDSYNQFWQVYRNVLITISARITGSFDPNNTILVLTLHDDVGNRVELGPGKEGGIFAPHSEAIDKEHGRNPLDSEVMQMEFPVNADGHMMPAKQKVNIRYMVNTPGGRRGVQTGKVYPTYRLRLSVKGDDTVAPIETGEFQIYTRAFNAKIDGKKSNEGAGPSNASTTPPLEDRDDEGANLLLGLKK